MSIFLAAPGTADAFPQSKDLAVNALLESQTTASSSFSCRDSDNGLEYYQKGSVESTSGTGIFKSADRCLSAIKLLEYSCKNDAWYANYYECEHGCKDGACLTTEASGSTGVAIYGPLSGDDLSAFVDRFIADLEEGSFSFGTGQSEVTDAQEMKDDYLEYLENIHLEDKDIETKDDLQKLLDEYFRDKAGETQSGSAADTSEVFPDGTLIRVPGKDKVYVIRGGMKEWIKTAEEFNRQGYDWNEIRNVNEDALEKIKDRIKLIKDELDKVYEIINGKALWIPSVAAFDAAGHKWEDVEDMHGAIDGLFDKVDILENDGSFYHITPNGKKQLLTSQEALRSLMADYAGENGFWDDVFRLSSFKDQERYLELIEDAKLIREEGDFRVYEVIDGNKRWISSPEELAQKGYLWQDIVTVNPKIFGSYILTEKK